MRAKARTQLSVKDYVQGILGADRAMLARAITLIESRLAEHQCRAQEVLKQIHAQTGNSIRVGISGVPGVGKSTFIDALGSHLTDHNHAVAVLAVDPSSSRTGGSIMGDKTRMPSLATNPKAFIRPSPTTGALGGVTRVTRESILLCEAAGFDVILVETVGVGQSEVTIANMVDFYLLLLLPGAGDELQGIKKGVLEVADMIAVNKADPEDSTKALAAASTYRSALQIMSPVTPYWKPPVTTCSALHKVGIAEIWQTVLDFKSQMEKENQWQHNRDKQQIDWMWSLIESHLLSRLHDEGHISTKIAEFEQQVLKGEVTPMAASIEIAQLFYRTH